MTIISKFFATKVNDPAIIFSAVELSSMLIIDEFINRQQS